MLAIHPIRRNSRRPAAFLASSAAKAWLALGLEHAPLDRFRYKGFRLTAAGFLHNVIAILKITHQILKVRWGIQQGPDAGARGVEVQVLGVFWVEQTHFAVEFGSADVGIAAEQHGQVLLLVHPVSNC